MIAIFGCGCPSMMTANADRDADQVGLIIAGCYDRTTIINVDGSTEEGSALRGSQLQEAFSSFTRILSEAGIGTVIAWGDIAMMFYGIPISFTRYHVLIPDSSFEAARKALLAEGYIDNAPTYLRWLDLGAPYCEMSSSRHPEHFSLFFMLGFSAVSPIFDDVDITGYKQIGGIAFPPLLTLARSFLYALSRSKLDREGLALHTFLQCWCSYTKTLGYKPLGSTAMRGQHLDEKLVSFWESGRWEEPARD